MKKYSMTEWLKIHNDVKEKEGEGETNINGICCDKEGHIKYLEVSSYCGLGTTAYGGLSPNRVRGIVGNKQFVLENGEVNLYVDCDEQLKSIVTERKIDSKNLKVIPFKDWTVDYVDSFNHKWKEVNETYVDDLKRDEDRIRRFEVTGYRLTKEGHILSLLADITYDKDYGSFGPIVSEDCHIEIQRDILGGTYGMQAIDVCDGWEGGYRTPRIYHAYFNNNLDVVYDGDFAYGINEGRTKEGLIFCPRSREEEKKGFAKFRMLPKIIRERDEENKRKREESLRRIVKNVA